MKTDPDVLARRIGSCAMCFGSCDILADRCPHCGYNPDHLRLDQPPPPRTHKPPCFWTDNLGRSSCPYIRRYVLDLGPFSIRLHRWYSDDDQRALHDHPWPFLTVVLWGSYQDVTAHDYVPPLNSGMSEGCAYAAGKSRWGRLRFDKHCSKAKSEHPVEHIDTLRIGSIRYRPALWAHTVRTSGCVSLVFTGRSIRAFGFYVPRKLDGVRRWVKANKFFATFGYPPCAD